MESNLVILLMIVPAVRQIIDRVHQHTHTPRDAADAASVWQDLFGKAQILSVDHFSGRRPS